MNDSLKAKEQRAIEVLKGFEPSDEPYHLCYSGGKDSDCIRILAELAGVKHDIVHNLTTVDAPETLQYIKSIPNIIINKARYNLDGKIVKAGDHKTMWNLLPEKMSPPTRISRYCCAELKEQGGKGRLKITGVRKAESRNRKENGGLVKIIGKPVTVQKYLENNQTEFVKTNMGGIVLNMDNDEQRRAVEHCFRTTSTMVNPIVDWTDEDVWEFLNYYGCKSNPLYQCGQKRIGCIGCPMSRAKNMKRDFAEYPKFRNNYIRAFNKMLLVMKDKEKPITNWHNGIDVLRWWVGDDVTQLTFETPEYLKDIPDELFKNVI